MIFKDRVEAGQLLAKKLEKEIKKAQNVVVLAIPRGGVVVGKELSQFLSCPLDVIVTKKIGAPNNPELAIGAVGTIGEPVIDKDLANQTGASQEYLQSQISQIKTQVKERETRFRVGRPALNLKDKLVIITDDGVATGATMKAAVEIVRQQNPKKIMVAVPVIAQDTLGEIEKLADEVVFIQAPKLFFAVGQFYQNFEQVSDSHVIKLLLKS